MSNSILRIEIDAPPCKANQLGAIMKNGLLGYLSLAQVEELEADSRLVKEPFDVTYADGTVRFDVDLPPHAIAAVTLELTPGSPDGGAAT